MAAWRGRHGKDPEPAPRRRPGSSLGARTMPKLVFDPVFGSYLAGRLLSTMAFWIHTIVATILIFQLTGSAFLVGLVSIAQFIPQLLFAPLSGAVADRGDRRKQVIAGRLVCAAGSGGLAIWIGLSGVDGLPGATPVVLAALIVGIGFVIGGPAMNALLPALVREGEITAAVTLNTVPVTLARATGPAVGALVASHAGPGSAFAIAAGGHLAFALVMLPMPGGGHQLLKDGMDASVRGAFRYLHADPVLVLLLLGVAAVGIGADPAITLAPPLSHSFGGGAELVGIFASSFGIGSGIAFLLLSMLKHWTGLATICTVGLCLLSGGTLLAALAPTVLLAARKSVV